MKFDSPAQTNPIDQLKIVGKPTPRIDGPLKTTGTAPYAYERHNVVPGQAYGYVLGAGIAKGRIKAMNIAHAQQAPGVIGVLNTLDFEPAPLGSQNTANLFGGAEIQHYHQAIAMVVAETFEQARAAAHMIIVEYEREQGNFDLAKLAPDAPLVKGGNGEPSVESYGDFDSAYAAAPVKLDATYTTPDETHAMMEPHATIAAWDGDKVTVWMSHQMIQWGKVALAKALGVPQENVRIDSPFIGGGFGGKLFIRADVVVAALAARKFQRPVKVTLQRPLIINNTTHRPATIQRIQLGAGKDGKLTAISHESTSGNLPGGGPEGAVNQTQLFYAGANRRTALRIAELDLPEGNAMRAPGEAPGLMALEIAMDELAEKLSMDPVELRIVNDTQVDPMNPDRPFSYRDLVGCLRRGAEAFGWDKRNPKPAANRKGRWLIGQDRKSVV